MVEKKLSDNKNCLRQMIQMANNNRFMIQNKVHRKMIEI